MTRKLVGTLLRRAGLYHPIVRGLRVLTEEQYRKNQAEVRRDIASTRQVVKRWAREGADRADPGKIFGIVSFTNLPLHAKLHCLLAKAMQLRGYTPIVFTFAGCRAGHQYFKLFGIERLVFWDRFVEERVDRDAVAAIAQELVPAPVSPGAVARVTFRGVEVGKHALSVTCRRRLEGHLDLSRPETWAVFQQELQRAIQAVLGAEIFFAEQPVDKLLVRDAGYTPNGALLEWGLSRGTDCVVYEQGLRRGTWIFRRYTRETRSEYYLTLAPPTWERIKALPWTETDEQKLQAMFERIYDTRSNEDTRRLMTGKTHKTPDEVREQLGLDPAKKTAAIFSHVAWDATFFFGTCLFDDVEAWLFETVQFVARECPHMNWIVKLHPFNVFKLQRESKSEESEMTLLRRLMPLPDHVKLVRAHTDISTRSLFPIVDYVLTVTGTVGMEFPCFGVPAVLAGTGRYEGRGFTIEPKSRAEYFETLRSLHTVPKLDRPTQELARKYYFHLTTRRQLSLEDVAPMELRRVNEAVSDVHDNINIRPRSLAEFAAAQSIRRAGDWLAYSTEPDILDDPG